jgi:predicted MFS family arabinose efflux permease
MMDVPPVEATRGPSRIAPDVAAGFAALLLGIGIGRFAFPPLIPVLALHHWFSASAADFLASINLVGYIGGAFLAGRLGHARPVEPWVKASMVAVILSYGLCAWPWPFVWFAIWRLAAGVAAGLLMVLAIPTVLARVPMDRRGLASGLIFTGIGAGEVLAGAAVPILAEQSVAAAWWGMAALALVATVAVWPYWHPRPNALADVTLARHERMHLHGRMPRLLATYGLAAIAFAPFSLYWVDFLARGLDLGTVRAGHFWSLFGLAAIGGPLLAGLCAARWPIRWTLLVWYLLTAATALLPLRASAAWALIAATLMLGGFGPAITSLSSGRILELMPPAAQKRAWGLMTAVFSMAYAGSAALMSWIFARTGSYALPFDLAWAALALATVLIAV